MTVTDYEVELKIAISEEESTEAALIELGAKKTNMETQIDIYFDHPCKSFEETDEALRIRSRSNITKSEDSSSIPIQKTEMTYKGPKVDTTTKTRLEISIGLDNLSSAITLLGQLGFRNVATIKKKRSFFLLQNIVVSIDSVEDVGLFLELEKVVASEDAISAARTVLFEILHKLGYNPRDSIRESYLELYLRKEHS